MNWEDGTPKSTCNAFNWKANVRDSVIAQDYQNCTTAYNRWRQGEGPIARMTWPQYRDKEAAKLTTMDVKTWQQMQSFDNQSGFRKNGGTMTGISKKGDEWAAKPHGGAYTKAKGNNLPSYIHRKVAA